MPIHAAVMPPSARLKKPHIDGRKISNYNSPQKKAGKKAQNPHVMGTGRKKASSQIFNLNYADLFWRLSIKSSTTPGSASVDVSPRLEKSSSAIFLKIRRMILPDRVFGKPGAN